MRGRLAHDGNREESGRSASGPLGVFAIGETFGSRRGQGGVGDGEIDIAYGSERT